jgi:hypothetical protein
VREGLPANFATTFFVLPSGTVSRLDRNVPSFQKVRSHSLFRPLCCMRRNPSRFPSGARKDGARPRRNPPHAENPFFPDKREWDLWGCAQGDIFNEA